MIHITESPRLVRMTGPEKYSVKRKRTLGLHFAKSQRHKKIVLEQGL